MRTFKPISDREQLNRKLMLLYRPFLTKFPSTNFVKVLLERYKVNETRLMTLEQLEDLVQFIEGKLRTADARDRVTPVPQDREGHPA